MNPTSTLSGKRLRSIEHFSKFARSVLKIFSLMVILAPFHVWAQQGEPLLECKTVLPVGDSLDSLYSRHQQFLAGIEVNVPLKLADLKIVPVQFHIVKMDNGTGGIISNADLLNELMTVNADFQPAGIIFSACGSANQINSSEYFTLTDFAEGDQMSIDHNDPNVLNVFVVDDPAGYCGWASFTTMTRDYVVLDDNCANNGTTMTHEFGHYFDLFHTHDTTWGHELVNGSNCMMTGDLLCDTPADPQLSEAVVDVACMYTGAATDANSDPYMPDVTNFMSYSRKACRSTFSPLQIQKISYTAENGRSNLNLINCPFGAIAYVNSDCDLIMPDYRDSITLTLPCDLVDTMQTPAPGSVIAGLGFTEVTISVTDANDDVSSCSFFVTLLDSIKPQLTMIAPDSITTNLECEGLLPDYRDSTTVTDNCDPNPFVTQKPAPGTNIGGVGTMQTVLVIAEDGSGNADTLEVEVVVVDSIADAQLNCRNLNLGIGLNDQVQFRLDELVPGSNCSELHTIVIANAFGGIVYQASGLIRNSIIAFLACDYIGQELKATVTNEAGASAWGLLTIKQGNGPILTGRSFELWCYDERIADLAVYHQDFDYPSAYIPCLGYVQPQFVIDWILPFDCEADGQDTAKIIYREYEAFDKSGLRSFVFDTIIVYRIPKLHFESFFCPGNQELYCSDTNAFASPTIIFGNPALTGSVDLLDVRPNGKDLEFLAVELDPKCGLQVKVDYWKYGQGTCEQEYKVAVELKQICPGSLSNLAISVISPNAFEALDTDTTYWRCEFWVTNQDTTPPLVAGKVIGEYDCLVLSSDNVLDDNFFSNFAPLVNTSVHSCEASTVVPPVCVFDDWSGIKTVKATIEGIGTYSMAPTDDSCLIFVAPDGGFSFGGEYTQQILEDLEAIYGDSIPQEILDQIRVGTCYRSAVQMVLPMRETPYLVIYEVTDSCHNIGRDTALIQVKDQVEPIAVADKGVTVSLSDKKVWVDAETFDEGSWDNCGIEFILARRSDWKENCVDLCHNYDETCESEEEALCWLWTDGHDTLWILNLENDKHCDAVEAHYQKQLDWFCEDGSDCGAMLYNSWIYDLIKYATVECKGDGLLDDAAFEEIFKRAAFDPQPNDQFKITNDSLLAFYQDIPLPDSFFIDSNHIIGISLPLDVFKCEEVLNDFCIDLLNEGSEGSIFDGPELLEFLIGGACASSLNPELPDILIPTIMPPSLQNELLDNWKSIGGGWSDAVPFSCEDACGPVTVEILVMDYWCNWSTAWTNVWVEDKTPVEVVKDVIEEEVITCKVYKENNYAFPGEEHPVSIQYIVDQAKTGEQYAFDALDGIFGGYSKAWRDPYGNYVDSAGVEIECEIPFYDSVCYCKDTTIKIRIYDDHLGYLWIDSMVRECYYAADTLNFQKGLVVVNCADNIYCEQEVWCEFDHCGQGYIFRKFKIWQGCPEGSYEGLPDSLRHPVDTIYRHQRIWVGNECPLDKYMFDVPYDAEVFSCDIRYGADGNVIGDAGPENTGYATYNFDDDCRLVGIAHEDKVFKIVGGEEACYKILRTWYFADWCSKEGAGIPEGKWWLDEDFVLDKCVQKIIVRDTVAPICLIRGPVEDGGSVELSACTYSLAVEVDAQDACGVISYFWELKDITKEGNHLLFDSGDGALDGAEKGNFDISSQGLYPGTYQLKVRINDDCSNESYCEYTIEVLPGKKPTPICITSLTATLTPWDSDGDGVEDSAHAVVWAEEYDQSSQLACSDDSLEYRIEFIGDSPANEIPEAGFTSLEVTCANIGTQLVRMWVISHPSMTADFCDAILMVQSDGSGCPTRQGTGERVANMEKQTQVGTPKSRSEGNPGINVVGDMGQFDAEGFDLEQNTPNPFQHETKIGFTLPVSMEASIEVFDVTGRMVKFFKGSFVKGHNSVRIQRNELHGTGVLYYRMQAENFTSTRRMIVIE